MVLRGWYCACLRVLQMLASFPASSMLLTLRLMHCLTGVVCFPSFIFCMGTACFHFALCCRITCKPTASVLSLWHGHDVSQNLTPQALCSNALTAQMAQSVFIACATLGIFARHDALFMESDRQTVKRIYIAGPSHPRAYFPNSSSWARWVLWVCEYSRIPLRRTIG